MHPSQILQDRDCDKNCWWKDNQCSGNFGINHDQENWRRQVGFRSRCNSDTSVSFATSTNFRNFSFQKFLDVQIIRRKSRICLWKRQGWFPFFFFPSLRGDEGRARLPQQINANFNVVNLTCSLRCRRHGAAAPTISRRPSTTPRASRRPPPRRPSRRRNLLLNRPSDPEISFQKRILWSTKRLKRK